MQGLIATIPLGLPLPAGSSHLPAHIGRDILSGSAGRAPIWCCSGWRLPRFTPCTTCAVQGLVSVALFLAFIAAFAATYNVRALPGTPLCGARTFLHGTFLPHRSDRPASFPAIVVECGRRIRAVAPDQASTAASPCNSFAAARNLGMTPSAKRSMLRRVRSAGSVPNCSMVSRLPNPIAFM